MPPKGWVSIGLKAPLVDKIDTFIARNDEGFTNRSEVVAAAVREFLDDYVNRKARWAAMRKPPTPSRRRAAGSKAPKRVV